MQFFLKKLKQAAVAALSVVMAISFCACAQRPKDTPSIPTTPQPSSTKAPTETTSAFSQKPTPTPSVSLGGYMPTAEPILWVSNCDEFITLRAQPGGQHVLATIPRGETFIFEKWQAQYALVSYRGLRGYVHASYIEPANYDNYFSQRLETVSPTAQYTYKQLKEDIAALQKKYPHVIRSSSIGYSEMGREIPVLQIGQLDAPHHVLLQAAIHGREHMTAWLVMAIVDYALPRAYFDLEHVCFHIIPMANPDGVTISQSGALGADQAFIYNQDLNSGYTGAAYSNYAARWKANALGVDLNRNFPSGWTESSTRAQPSSEKYRGEAPFCAAEAAALRDYTLRFPLDATISFHASGSILYYKYGKRPEVIEQSRNLAVAIEQISGYPLVSYDGTDGAGYKDWCMEELGIPSITVEIGGGSAPLPESELPSVFSRFCKTVPMLNAWLLSNTQDKPIAKPKQTLAPHPPR